MNESMYKYMRVGIIHFMIFPGTIGGEGPIVETVRRLAADEYFNALEVTWIKNPDSRKKVREILDVSHMTVAYGAQPRLLTTGLNINDTVEEERRKAVDMLKAGIDEAVEIGAQGFAFLSGKYEESSKDDAYNALVKSTGEICAYAEKKGSLKVALEIFDYDVDKKSLIGPADLAARFAAEIRNEYDNFGLMVDLSHLPLLRETANESITVLKDYIVHAHMGNCVTDPELPGYGDNHPRFGFPGGKNDVVELTEYLRVLLSTGFLNKESPPVVSFEVKPFGDEDPELVIANAKRVLNESWARV